MSVSLNDVDNLSSDWINILVVLGVDVWEWVFGILLVDQVPVLSQFMWLLSITLDWVDNLSSNWINVLMVLGMDVWEWVLSVLFIDNIELNKLAIIMSLNHSISLDHILTLEVEDLLLLWKSCWYLSWLSLWWWNDGSDLWLTLFLVLFFVLNNEFERTTMSVVILTILSSLLESLESGELLITVRHLLGLLDKEGVTPDWSLIAQEFLGANETEQSHNSN